jgi:hypothetical protein
MAIIAPSRGFMLRISVQSGVTKITVLNRYVTRTCGACPAINWPGELERRRSFRGSIREKGGHVVGRDSKDNWGTAQSRNTIGGRRAAMRVVMDRLNGMVVVYEQDATGVEGGPRNLVFEATSGVTRLDAFPLDWRRLSDEALLALRYPQS